MNSKALVEALIFASNKPISIRNLSKITGISKTELQKLIDEIRIEYSDQKHGVMLKKVGESYLFLTKPEYHEYVEKVSDRGISNLTPSQIEVLAYIAFKGPITRKELHEIRGKSADNILRDLQNMRLISKRRSKRKGKPYEYTVTKKLREILHIASMEEFINEVAEISPDDS
ncbi:MAG: SMC-Scp complex subunit ScpB [Thermotogae bacterium]|nr:SMC-Scp complex subunit ScpB [Thermotogota bacterium]